MELKELCDCSHEKRTLLNCCEFVKTLNTYGIRQCKLDLVAETSVYVMNGVLRVSPLDLPTQLQ
ncbi:hypothetical protein OUZ56_024804 [Daphnia magna]|uniref:Uncharacterized protein n=1 Tax=Daphnia magna TaxID=35525 RepID=A0ABQ9ZI16_9CRUS|nr:hypothetical protein OUZ56_024804 [Daphnia magna]